MLQRVMIEYVQAVKEVAAAEAHVFKEATVRIMVESVHIDQTNT